jgi:hypothetical protein
VYTKGSNDIWQLTDKLTINDGRYYMVEAAIALSGDVIALAQSLSPSAYVFGLNKSTGKCEKADKLTLSDSSDVMVGSIGVSENIVVLGAYNNRIGGGSVYIYELDPKSGIWHEDYKYVPEGGLSDVDVDGYSITVGSSRIRNGSYAWILEKDQASGVWEQKAEYVLEPELFEQAEVSVGISKGTTIVGQPFYDNGLVYILW